jgi:hypothetical protein
MNLQGRVLNVSGMMASVSLDRGGMMVAQLRTDEDGRLYVEQPPDEVRERMEHIQANWNEQT